MICTRCNSEVSESDKFCAVCGNKLVDIRSRQPAGNTYSQNMMEESEDTTLLEEPQFYGYQKESEETTLLENVYQEESEATTLLDSAPDFSQRSVSTIQPPPNNPAAPMTAYRYKPKEENSKKDKIIVISAIAVAVIFIAVVLILT